MGLELKFFENDINNCDSYLWSFLKMILMALPFVAYLPGTQLLSLLFMLY